MATLKSYTSGLQGGTRFIPLWVKVVRRHRARPGHHGRVETDRGHGGRAHRQSSYLTYAQGASAETVAALTIELAELYGLPVSTTHILSSGVAGTMAANGSGLQWSTVGNIAAAWVLTLPAAITLAGVLYFILRAGVLDPDLNRVGSGLNIQSPSAAQGSWANSA